MYEIKVDKENRRILVSWGSSVTGEGLMTYQREVWNDSEIHGFDELLDFRALEDIQITAGALASVANLAAKMDTGEEFSEKPRTAIVVQGELAYGLSRMYESLREYQTTAGREVMVFKSMDQAVDWLNEPH